MAKYTSHTHAHTHIHAHNKPFIPLQYLFKLISPLRVVFFPLFFWFFLCCCNFFFARGRAGACPSCVRFLCCPRSKSHSIFLYSSVRSLFQSKIKLCTSVCEARMYEREWLYDMHMVVWHGLYCDITRLLNFVLFYYYLNFISF